MRLGSVRQSVTAAHAAATPPASSQPEFVPTARRSAPWIPTVAPDPVWPVRATPAHVYQGAPRRASAIEITHGAASFAQHGIDMAAMQDAAMQDAAMAAVPRRKWASLTEDEFSDYQNWGQQPQSQTVQAMQAAQEVRRRWDSITEEDGRREEQDASGQCMHPGFQPAQGTAAYGGPPPNASAIQRRRWASITDDDVGRFWPTGGAGAASWSAAPSQPSARLQQPWSRQGAPPPGPPPGVLPARPPMSPEAMAQAAAYRGGIPGQPWSPFMMPPMPYAPNGMPAGGPPGAMMPPGYVAMPGQHQAMPHNMMAMLPVPAAGPQSCPATPASGLQSPTSPGSAGQGALTSSPRGRGARAARSAAVSSATSGPSSPMMKSPKSFNGWSAIWVGERAFRAPASMKEQVEGIGFLLKIYRSHEKCARALDKKAHVASTNVFVVSAADAEPMAAYLVGRGATDLRIIVDAAPNVPDGAPATPPTTLTSCPRDSSVTFASSWDEVVAQLRAVVLEAAQFPISPRDSRPGFDAVTPRGQASVPSTPMSATDFFSPTAAGQDMAGETPWTLVWISDQAFKPAATSLKAQLESLGGQVKGYKTHKNAARALDKKRALVRTVVLVSGAEAAPFLAYLQSRPELGQTKVVVEAPAKASPLHTIVGSECCEVADGFDGAVAAIQKAVSDAGFK